MTTHKDIPEVPPYKPVYSIEELAGLLGLHRSTVSGFIARGELTASRLGHRTVRVTHEALMEFLKAKEVSPPPGPGKARRSRGGPQG